MTQHDDFLYLVDMLDSARKARELVQPFDKEGYDSNEMLQLALARLIQIIGETASRVSPERRIMLNEIAWHQAIAMRHRLVHDYGNIQSDIVWQSVVDDLPLLIKALEEVIPPDLLEDDPS